MVGFEGGLKAGNGKQKACRPTNARSANFSALEKGASGLQAAETSGFSFLDLKAERRHHRRIGKYILAP